MLVTGANGLMGRALVSASRDRSIEVVATDQSSMDVTRADDVQRVTEDVAPDVIVHCAAYTDVDGAEGQPAIAMAVNREGTRHVARAAAAVGCRLVYSSTDFVFDGARRAPYLPRDAANPMTVYGRSKLAGEEEVRSVDGLDWVVLRTSWLYGDGGKNFVDTVLKRASTGERLRVVSDQVGRPTWTGSLAPALLDLIAAGASGVHHLADRGEVSWLEFARAALELSELDYPVEATTTEAWGAPASRPPYSVLDTEHTERLLGRQMPHWRDSLRSYLARRNARAESV